MAAIAGEIAGRREGFIEAVFDGTSVNDALRWPAELAGIDRAEAAARLVRGGFPEAVTRTSPRRRSRLFASYVSDLINRDIREISDIENAGQLRRMLQLLAARMGQVLSAQRLAAELEISGRTVSRYLELCEEVFLIKRIPAWSSNLGKRVVSSPKVAFVDSGIAAYLLGQDADRISALTSATIGPLLAGFVSMELARQATWTTEETRLFHYRTKDQVEVDAVLETNDGRVAGVEVKASATGDSRGFPRLASVTQPSWRRIHGRGRSVSRSAGAALRGSPSGASRKCIMGNADSVSRLVRFDLEDEGIPD